MAKVLTPDICVIGAGQGGLAVATGAAAYGVKVVLIDKGPMGGSRLGRTLPASALAAAARHAEAMRTAGRFGIDGAAPEIDFKAMMAQVREAAAAAAPSVSPERLATLGVMVINADARFTGRRRLVAGDTEIRARRYVLATGSSPIVPDIPGIGEIGCLTGDTVFDLARRPGHLVIIGGDPVGIQLAQAFRRLGSQVTVLAEAGGVLPGEDPEMASVVVRRLRAEGVELREGVKVTGVERRGKTSVRVLIETADGNDDVDGSHLLVALGRTPDVEKLDLKKARVALKDNAVDVSAMLRTTNRRIYAIGGVTGALQSQAAAYQADLVLKALLFRLPAKDRAIVPSAVYTDPELARAGLTEAQAAKRHRKLTILRWPFAENDRARAERRTEGHVKVVAARNGDILGVTIAGANASELIGIWALALSRGLGLKDMASSIPPHSTFGEIGKSAAIAYFAKETRRPLARGMVRLLQLFG